MSVRNVRVYLMGGTIAATIDEHGNSVLTDLKDFVQQFHAFDGKVNIDVNSFSKLGGFETRIEDVVPLANELNRAVQEDNLDGIVVIMGTNLMEEIAFAIHILVPSEIPIVVTGAMRIATAISADGAGNLFSAIATAADPACRGMGTLVVFNDEIHSAQFVQKMHTANTSAFKSEFLLGYVVEGKASIRTKPLKRSLPWLKVGTEPKDVLLYSSYFSDTGRILDALETIPYDGIVVDGTGCGSVAYWVLEKLDALHKKMPIVIAARPGHGDVLTATYGKGYGCPEYFVDNGYLMAGILDARKARVLLTFLLMAGCSEEEIRESFRRYSRDYIED